MKTIKVLGEVGKKDKWYTGYALITKTNEETIVEVQRWSYWCKKFGVSKAGKLLREKRIRRVGGVYTSPEKSYNISRLKKELLFEERQRGIDNKICENS